MLTKSDKHNPNYLAQIVQLGEPMKHPNADRLQVFFINGCRVITDMSRKKGEIGVFFPIESKLNHELLSGLNMYQDGNMNVDNTKKGYVNSKGRVKAVRLREEPSMGLFLYIDKISEILGTPIRYVIGEEFDMWNDKLICEKYVPAKEKKTNTQVKGKQPVKISRLIDNQFRLHEDTLNLRKNIHKLSPRDIISITKKLHGTSWVVGNVLTKKPLSRWQRFLKWCGADIKEETYDIIYSSRSVVKNGFVNANPQHYNSVDLWADIKDSLNDKIPSGFTLYGEVVGYTSTGRMIQKKYDYGYKPPALREDYKEGIYFGVYVYRITFTNVEGKKYELSWGQIKEYCNYFGIKHVPELYYGYAGNWFTEKQEELYWHTNLLESLEETFLEKNCTLCTGKVPDEGIVVRKDGLYDFEAYKLKSFRFLEHETKMLDEEVEDIEDVEEEISSDTTV